MNRDEIDVLAPGMPEGRSLGRTWLDSWSGLAQVGTDPGAPARELFLMTPAHAACWWFGAFTAGVFVCDMPNVIELDEIARPFWSVRAFEHTAENDLQAEEFEPPLVAAGRFRALATHGTLPPLEWDE